MYVPQRQLEVFLPEKRTLVMNKDRTPSLSLEHAAGDGGTDILEYSAEKITDRQTDR